MKALSIVVPVMNERETIATLCEEIATVLSAERPGQDYEIVFVDDGSNDGSWDAIAAAAARWPTVRGLRLRRNFGKAAALRQGIAVSRGQIVVTMDGDLQDDPTEIPRFLEPIESGRCDLVSGWKQVRHDPLGKTLPSRLFNFITRKLSGVALHDFNCGFKAYRREIFDSVALYGELHRFIPVLANSVGYRVGEVVVNHRPRQFGQSKYGAKRLVKGIIDLLTVLTITRFGTRPAHLFGGAGLVVLLVGLIVNLYLTWLWLHGVPIGQRPLLNLGVLLIIIGVQLLLFGAMAELAVSHNEREPARHLVAQTVGDAHAP